MTLHINDAGTWRTIQNVYVNDAGTWREIQEVYINDGGTWRSVHVNDVITLPDLDSLATNAGTAVTAWFRLGNDGNIYMNNGGDVAVTDVGDWITPQTNMANYECFATLNSGTLTSGTTGAWQSLGSSREWTVQRVLVGISTANLTIQIRRASDATVLDTATITISADRAS